MTGYIPDWPKVSRETFRKALDRWDYTRVGLAVQTDYHHHSQWFGVHDERKEEFYLKPEYIACLDA